MKNYQFIPASETVKETTEPTQIYTGDHGDTNINQTGNEILDAHNYLEKLRQEKQDNLPLEKKLALVLDRSDLAQKLAALAVKRNTELQRSMTQGFDKIHRMLTRLANNQPLEDDSDPNEHVLYNDEDY